MHSALENAVNEPLTRRDGNLISLFLHHSADVNFNGGHGIVTAITQNEYVTQSQLLLHLAMFQDTITTAALY